MPTQTRNDLLVSFFLFVLATVVGGFYWVLRMGFLENSPLIVVKVICCAGFILFTPFLLRLLRKKEQAADCIFLNNTITPLYALLLIAVFGYLGVQINSVISWLFSGIGFFVCLLAIRETFKSIVWWQVLILSAIAGYFAFWIGSVSWLWYLKPYIIENWAYGTDRVDTLFHVALAQMVKTYGIPSTGLDGLPQMNYHWGSHWLFAQLSKFLQVPVVVVYQLCYPVIIAPLLIRTLLSFILEVKSVKGLDNHSEKSDGITINLFFWIIFLSVFIGYFPSFFRGNTWAEFSPSGTGSTVLVLTSESYCLSIIMMFACFVALMRYWQNRRRISRLSEFLFLIILLPVFLMMIGFVKVSTLYIICALIGYFFLRLKMFTEWRLIGAFLLTVVAAGAALMLVFETKETHGDISWMYFYKNLNVPFLKIFILFHSWALIFIGVYFFMSRRAGVPIKKLFMSGGTIPLEAVVVASIAGLLPSLVLQIQNYDVMYFMELQMWLAAMLVLVYVPFMYENLVASRTIIIATVISIPLLYVFYLNTKSYTGAVYVQSKVHHYRVLEESGYSTEGLRSRNVIKKLSEFSLQEYEKNKVLSFLYKVRQLDELPDSEKRNSLVYVNLRKLFTNPAYHWGLGCHNISLVVPALSGMAMIDGFDVTYFELCGGCCEQTIEYLYGYYPKWKTREQIDQPQNIEVLSKRVASKGFEKLIYYDLEKEEFIKVKVSGSPAVR